MSGQNMESGSGRSGYDFRLLVIYAVSLILSILIIVISITVFIVIIYIRGTVSVTFFYLFIIIVASNFTIAGFSLRGLTRIYPSLIMEQRGRKSAFTDMAIHGSTEKSAKKPELKREYFTEAELEIIDLLKKNGNSMLQSAIVAATAMSKTTISRTLSALQDRGIIVKIRKGVTNEIILDETNFR
ncbi:MAG: helix-turn-helix transcriptional regulator [Thermoplasmata archaeon]